MDPEYLAKVLEITRIAMEPKKPILELEVPLIEKEQQDV